MSHWSRVIAGASCVVAALFAGAGWVRAQEVIAYEVPADTVGNQDDATIALGHDFDVLLDIRVTRLGVFDSGSNGLSNPLVARLYDRDTLEELGVVDFTPEDPGELIGGSRFKPFTTVLPAGFRGTVTAAGYGGEEPNGNTHGALTGFPWTVNDGGCSILFTGGGRFGNDDISYPGTADAGPPDRYAAGTFAFEPLEAPPAPTGAIAYYVPAGTLGNQNANVALGLDFNVNVGIRVTRLGVFDSGSDGLLTPLTARIYDRDSEAELTSLEFLPGDEGELVDGSRFKDLVEPLRLPAGFHGTIVGEGYNDLELNGNQGVSPIDGTAMDGGNCAITFRGGGRNGALGTFPTAGDGGPPNRYLAGTFEFDIDLGDPPPDTPVNFSARAGDGRVDLSWEDPPGGTPAAKYVIQRGPTAAGPFAVLAETTELQYADTGLPNEAQVCYFVRAVAGDGTESFDSAHRCAVPTPPPPPGRFIAYQAPEGTPGSQDFGGAYGLDFDISADIRVTRIGVFDPDSDGLSRPICARLYDRDTMATLAEMEFTPDDPGVLIGGHRFKTLAEPVELLAGSHGTVAAGGYGGGDLGGNTDGTRDIGLTLDDGGCRISFVGSSRFGNDSCFFPGTPDGGPVNRYAAGTFEFEVLGQPIDPTPQPPLNFRLISSQFTAEGGTVTVAWAAAIDRPCVLPATGYRVLRSVNGAAFTAIGDTVDTSFTDTLAGGGALPESLCYVVRSLADGGLSSGDSSPVCVAPGRTIAYVVPSGTNGDQVDPAPIGMDFDVLQDVAITHLGAFDSGGDGFVAPITISIFDRTSEELLASMDFNVGETPPLLNGSRFQPLPLPVELPAGLQATIVASGYGVDEPYGAFGPWTTDPGPCSLAFVGTSRSVVGGSLLPLPNATGRPDQYAAGTFLFEPRKFGTPRSAIAYNVPAGTVGNQAFTGSLGLDFNVNVPIKVTRLGVFDSGSDGLSRNIRARLYNRETQENLAEVLFTTADPGELVEGSRFKPLDPPLDLAPGFHGTISAGGYAASEPNGNSDSGATPAPWTTDDGGCAITFVGGGRFGQLASLFPVRVDNGPVNRYAAGTFEFEVEGGPPVPVFSRGDADQNGQLQLTDAVQILGYLFLGIVTKVPDCLDAADADDNGEVQLTDAVRILGFLFLGGPAPPAPFDPPGPRCGADESEDELDCAVFVSCP